MESIYRLITAIACGLIAAGPAAGAPISSVADQKAIDEVRATEARMQHDTDARDAAKVASYYSDDANAIGPVGVLHGRAAIESFLTPLYADGTFAAAASVDSAGVSDAGDMAWVQGHCSESIGGHADHPVFSVQCAFLTIFRRGPDGAWKIIEDMETPIWKRGS